MKNKDSYFRLTALGTAVLVITLTAAFGTSCTGTVSQVFEESTSAQNAAACQKLTKKAEANSFESQEFLDSYVKPLQQFSKEVQIDGILHTPTRKCLQGQFDSLLTRAKSFDTDLDYVSKSNLSLAIAALGKALSQYTPNENLFKSVLESEESLQLFLQGRNLVRLAELKKALLAAETREDEEKLLKLREHIDGGSFARHIARFDAPFLHLEEDADQFLTEVSVAAVPLIDSEAAETEQPETPKIPQEKREIIARLMLHSIFKSAYSYSRFGKEEDIDLLTSIREQMRREVSRARPFSEKRKQAKETVVSVEKQLNEVRDTEYGVAQLKRKLVSVLNKHELDGASLVAQEFREALRSLEKGYTIANMTVKEGDSWGQFGAGGLGEVFSRLVRSPTAHTHSGVVLKLVDEGLPLYVSAEISSTLSLRPLSIRSRSFARPKFQLPENISTKALANAEEFEDILFDVMYRPGFQNGDEDAFLYCSEFAHFFYQKLLDPDGTIRSSPFDETDNSLVATTDFVRQNLLKLGYDPQADFFIPSNLIYSPNMTYVGTIMDSGWVFEPTEQSTRYNQVSFAVLGQFFEDLQRGFESGVVRSPVFFEGRGIDLVLRFGEFTAQRSPESQEKLPQELDILLRNVDSKSPSRHATLLFLGSQNRIQSDLFKLVSDETYQAEDEEKKELSEIMEIYNSKFKKRVDSMFKFN